MAQKQTNLLQQKNEIHFNQTNSEMKAIKSGLLDTFKNGGMATA